jgi:hypothetical protein
MENTIKPSDSLLFNSYYEKIDKKEESNDEFMEHNYMLSKQSLGELNIKFSFSVNSFSAKSALAKTVSTKKL